MRQYGERLSQRRQYNPLHPHCGPGNYVDDVAPTDPVDLSCWAHDIKYGEENNMYLRNNKADKDFLESNALTVYKVPFALKRILLPSEEFRDKAMKRMRPNDELVLYDPSIQNALTIHSGNLEAAGKAVSVHSKSLSKNKESSMSRKYKSKGRQIGRTMRSQRELGAKINRHILKHKDESAMQTLNKIDTFAVRNTTFNTSAQVYNYINVQQDLEDMSLPTKEGPYSIRNSLTAGAYAAGGLQKIFRPDISYPNVLDETLATPTSNVKLNYRGGLTKYTIRNNELWDVYVEIRQYICMCSSSNGVEAFVEGEYDQIRHDPSDNISAHPLFPLGRIPDGDTWATQGKTVKFMLKPAQQVIFKVKHPKRLIEGRDLQVSAALTYFKDVSQCVVFRVRGGLVHDSTNKDLVGTGEGSIDVLRQDWKNWRHVLPPMLDTMYTRFEKDTITVDQQAQMDVEIVS